MMRFYFGHHKCASTYLHSVVIRRVCKSIGLKRRTVSSPEQFGSRLNQDLRDNRCDFLCYINADRAFVEPLNIPFRAIHVIRDPRDVVISAYFSHLRSHSTSGWPELVEFRKRLAGLSPKEGLLAELEFITLLPTNGYNLRPFQCMMEWNYSDNRILELRYEDMVSDPNTFFTRLGHHLGLSGGPVTTYISEVTSKLSGSHRKLKDSELLNLVARHSFVTLAGRARGHEDQTHHYRRGQPGDWRHYFDEDVTNEFKERFPGLLSRLGYETSDNDWDLHKR